jgi:CHAD domain-containing protein
MPDYTPLTSFSRTRRRKLTRFVKQALRDVLNHVRRALGALKNVEQDPVEITHDLRVASRRADVTLRIFHGWISQGQRTSLCRMLKRIRDDAGTVRDLDLIEQRWSTSPPRGLSADGIDWMLRRIRQQRDQAKVELRKWIHPRSLTRFRSHEKRVIRNVHVRSVRHGRRSIRDEFIQRIEQFTASIPTATGNFHDSHRSRIRARRLRYAMEMMSSEPGEDAVALTSSLATIQDQLGKINDDVASLEHLRDAIEICPDPHLAGEFRVLFEESATAAAARLAEWGRAMSPSLEQLQANLGQLARQLTAVESESPDQH